LCYLVKMPISEKGFEYGKDTHDIKKLNWMEKYHAFRRYLDHDSIRVGLGVPLSLLMVFYGTFAITGYLDIPRNLIVGAPLVLIGTFLLTRIILRRFILKKEQ
jgi:hypothetical protein